MFLIPDRRFELGLERGLNTVLSCMVDMIEGISDSVSGKTALQYSENDRR